MLSKSLPFVFGLSLFFAACGQGSENKKLVSKGWFVGVVTLPTDADVLNEERILIDWIVKDQTTQTNALRVAEDRQQQGLMQPQPLSAAAHRYALNVLRAAHERNKGRQQDKLFPLPIAQTANKTSCNTQCTNQQLCQLGSCVEQITLNTSLQGVGENDLISLKLVAVSTLGPTPISILIDEAIDTPANRALIQQAVDTFAKLMVQELALFGQTAHSGRLDVDGDGRLTIAFSNDPKIYSGSGIVAIVRPADFSDPVELPNVANGNYRDMLWSTIPTEQALYKLVANLVHEYVHLINATLRIEQRTTDAVAEVVWLDEGLAHLCEDLMGYGNTTIPLIQEAYNNWPQAMFASAQDSSSTRAAAYLLLRYILDTQAAARGARLVGDAPYMEEAKQVISTLINEPKKGFLHQLFIDWSVDGGKRFLDWVIQIHAYNNPELQDIVLDTASFLPKQNIDSSQRHIGIPVQGKITLFDGATTELKFVVDEATSIDSFFLQEISPSSTPLYWLPQLDGNQVQITVPTNTTGPIPVLHRKEVFARDNK